MANSTEERNLLFGIVALQMDFISRDDLIGAMNTWVLDKTKPLSQVLLDQGVLDADTHTLLEALVCKHLAKHNNDPAQSLAALGSPAAWPAATDQPLIEATQNPTDAASTITRSRFRILRPHARGGLGTVSVATDEELHREVALKEIQHPFADNPHYRARFVREARVTGGLEHPGVVPVYGLGHYADGRPFYAMRFIRGDSLQEAIARYHDASGYNKQSPEQGVAFRQLLGRFLDVCNAIGYAHSRGILHRDLKPGNVMLGEYGETLVVDWGLAKPGGAASDTALTTLHAPEELLTPALTEGSAPTQMGLAVGTPQYMSPEQAEGRLDLLGPASDVYSLGATFYCLLTGRAPFAGDLATVLHQVQRGQFPPVRQVNPQVPPALAAVCQKAMANRPADRYATPLALAADIEHWLADEPVTVYREPLGHRLARWVRRHRPLAAAAAAGLVAAAAVLVVSIVLIDRARDEEKQLRIHEDIARAEAGERAEGERLARERAQADRDSTLRTLLADCAHSADSNLAAAQLRWKALGSLHRQQDALDLLQQASLLRGQVDSALDQLGDAGGDLADKERRAWDQRRLALRDEAARWLTVLRFARSRSVPVPRERISVQLPDRAVSPDATHLAVINDLAREVTLIRFEGNVSRSLPFPEGAPAYRRASELNALRFVSDQVLELDLANEVLVWSLPEGKGRSRPRTPDEAVEWDRRKDEAQDRRDTRRQRLAQTQTAGWSARVWKGDPVTRWHYWVTVQSADQAERPRTVWRTTDSAMQPIVLRFGDNSRFLYLLTGNENLLALDLYSGLVAQEQIGDKADRKPATDLLPVHNGVAVFRKPDDNDPAETERLTLWHLNVPPVWNHGFIDDLPTSCLDLAADGALATGADDHLVRLWREHQPVWFAGLSSEEDIKPALVSSGGRSVPWWETSRMSPNPPNGTRNTRTIASRGATTQGGLWDHVLDIDEIRVDGIAVQPGPAEEATPASQRLLGASVTEKEGTKQRYVSWGLVTAGRQGKVVYLRRQQYHFWPPQVLREQFDWNANHDASYHWWGFAPRPNQDLFAVERRDARPDGRVQWQTELYQIADGELFHTFPATGVGRILAQPPGHQLAVVVAAEQPDSLTLDLWSLPEGQAMGRLGVFDVGKPPGPGRPTPAVGAYFSPSGRWLILVRETTSEAEVWQTAPLKRLATLPLLDRRVRCLFDPDEKRLLLAGPSYRLELPTADKRLDSPFAQVIELATGKTVCDLKGLDDLGCFADDALQFRQDRIIGISHGSLDGFPFFICLWDLKTGERKLLKQSLPEKVKPANWILHGGFSQLSPDGKQLAVTAAWENHQSKERQTPIQLWDLDGGKLIQQEALEKITLHEMRLIPDRGGFYLAPGPHFPRAPRELTLWKWSDGKRIPSRSLTLLAADDHFRWALWRGPEGVFLFHTGTNQFYNLPETKGAFDWRASSPIGRHLILEERRPGTGEKGDTTEVVSSLWDVSERRRVVQFPPGHRFLAFDPTIRRVATVHPVARELRLWNVQTGAEEHRLTNVPLLAEPGEHRLVLSSDTTEGRYRTERIDPIEARLHPDGKHLALLSQGVLQLWDVPNKKLLTVLSPPGLTARTRCVAQSIPAGQVAGGGDQGVVVLWDRRTGRRLHTLLGHAAPITALAYNPEGTHLVSASNDGTIALWRADGRLVWEHHAGPPGIRVTCLAFHPRDGTLAAGDSRGHVALLDVKGPRELAVGTTDGSAVAALVFASDGARLFSCSVAGQVQVWQGALAQSATWTGAEPITAAGQLAFLQGTNLLVCGGKVLQFWDTQSKRLVLTLPVANGPVRALAVNRDGNDLLVADHGNKVHVLDLASLREQLKRVQLDLP
jgi:WD40 repeat protein/tRNA A-37 threonylcarbamoyl transferase component Bud32